MEILISALCGIFITIVVFIVISGKEEIVDENIKIRLDKVKNKTFEIESNKAQKKTNSNIQEFFQYPEFKMKFVSELLNKFNLADDIKKRLKSADINMSVDVFFLMVLTLPVPFLLIAFFIPSQAFLIVPFGLLLAFVPFFMLNAKRKQHLDMFTKQFPDALGLVASALRAGHSLHSSFQTVVSEMPYPINGIFKTVVDDISLGRDTRDAMNGMIISMPDSLDLRFFVTAVLIQREIGGNLAEILDCLSNTIRERFKLLGQLKAQTAMAKMSGTILSVAPVLIGAVLWFMNPKYMEPLFNEPLGKMCLGGAIVSGIIGYLIIMKITDIKV